MPSPDLLPKGRSFPSAVAPPLDDVLRRAKFRRARRVGVIAGVAAVATAGAAFAFVPRGASDSLHTVTPTLPGHTTSPAPAAHRMTVHVVRTVPDHGKTHHGAGASATHGVTTTTPHGSDVGTTRSIQPGARDRGTAVQDTVGPPHRMTKFDASMGCTGNGPNPTTGWCSYYSGALSGAAGRAVVLATSVCRLPGQSTGVLYGNGHEADFAVGESAYPPRWRWKHGRTFSKAPTSIRVPAGQCVEWYVTWRVVNNAGRPLPSGKYYLDAFPNMQPAQGYAAAGTERPVDFTVR